MEYKIFYSWQNGLDKKLNRYFIEKSLKKAINRVNQSSEKKLNIDQATRNTKGAVDIATTIFSKIEKCQIFVADISIIDSKKKRNYPNPNVLTELGFAAAKVGWENMILIFNESSGKIEELPFDIRGRRILPYSVDDKIDEDGTKKE